MKKQTLGTILEMFKDTHFHRQWRLFTWHPRGVLDDTLADEIVGIVESEEFFEDAPFNRYSDFSQLTNIHLQIGHIFQIAEHRREVYEPVKSAIYADTTVGFGIARMFEELMKDAFIQVRAFRKRDEAADWLGVPVQVLEPEL